jgi:hypothetical protein
MLTTSLTVVPMKQAAAWSVTPKVINGTEFLSINSSITKHSSELSTFNLLISNKVQLATAGLWPQ